MAVFPDLPITSFKEESYRAIKKSSYEGGYEQKRPKYTRSYKKFSLGFNALTVEQAEALDEFIMDNQGYSFTFVHPSTAKTYEVTYDGDSIAIEWLTKDYRSTSIVLKEV